VIVLVVDANVAADYFRYLCLVMGAWIIVFATWIVVLNFHFAKQATGSVRDALLPVHIMGIATSYIIFVLSAHIRILYNVGKTAVWYGVPMTLVADVIGIFALGVIWRFQVEKRKAQNEVQE